MHDFVLHINNKSEILKILNLTINRILNRRQSKSDGQSEDIEFTVKYMENLCRQYCLQEINENDFKLHFSHLSSELQNCLVDTINSRRNEIEHYLISEINSRENPVLESFDWDVKWIFGNSQISSLKQQIATIVLNCYNSKQQEKQIIFELNEEKLDKLINVVEKSIIELE
uniref:COMM domain-containing protein n=1 Tax=Corethrella appendiculata TaxID=1370023 RepID=U5EUG8_9DIPT